MKKLVSVCVLAVACSFVLGCGKKEGGDGEGSGGKSAGSVVASCDQRGVAGMGFQTCNEYYGQNWTPKEVEAQCAGEKKFIAGACPKEGIVTSCKMYAGKPSELVTHYYDKAEEAKAACTRLEGQPL